MIVDHADALALMGDAVDERLDDDQERELALHLVGCPDCKADYDTLGRAMRAIGEAVSTLPSEDTVSNAIHRATTVLEGHADPGAPPLMPDEPSSPVTEDLPFSDDTGPLDSLGPDDEPVIAPHVGDEAGAQPPQAAQPPAWARDGSTSDELPRIVVPEPEPEPPSGTVSELDATGDLDEPAPTIVFDDEDDEDAIPTWVQPTEERAAVEDRQPALVFPQTHEISVQEQLPLPAREAARPRAAPWALGIAAALGLAALAGFLVARTPSGDGGGGDLPSAASVRRGVDAAFGELRSLKTSFTISRLGLYRVRQQNERVVYSFAVGTNTGRFVFDPAEGYREETALSVQDDELERSKVVVTPDEIRVLEGAGNDAELVVESNAPLGPPDGDLRPVLGILEDAVGSASRLLLDARDLRVVDRVTRDDRDAIRVRFTVQPDGYTRSDRIEMVVDARTFFPVEVRRTIGRDDAQVLGPSDVLGADALDAAFEGRDRVTTELVELTNLVVNDVILPGEFVLDASSGVQPETRDGGFEHTEQGELADRLPFAPLLPAALPAGYREQGYFTVFDGEPEAWGPNDSFPAPDGIMQAAYSDGKTTVVVSERNQPDGPFELTTSPLAAGGLPLETRSVVRGGHRLVYAASAEVPPHVYGFIGNVLVVVSGYAPPDDLLRIAGSLAADESAPAESPVATP